MTEALLGAGGAIFVAVLGLLGVRITARQTSKATDTGASLTARQLDLEEWNARLAEREKMLDRLGGEIKRLEDRSTRDRERIEALEAAGRTDRDRIEALEQQHATERRTWQQQYHVVLTYLRDVIAWARTLLPDHTPPAPPEDLAAKLRTDTD